MKTIHYAIIALLTLFALTLFTVGYLMFFDGKAINKIVEFDSTSIQTEFDTYKPGDSVRAYVSFCKYRPIIPEVEWSLVDTYIRFYQRKSNGTSSVDCFKDVLFDIEKIPLDSFRGKYQFSGKLYYKANVFRTVEYVLTTNFFEIK